jgi:GT2 family glycosyltransferase
MVAAVDATVVVPTRNRTESLRRTLRALAAQRTDCSWEVIVVDDGSDPPVPRDLSDGPPDCRIVRGEGDGPARARNLGWRAARGDVVLFTDDDIEPHPDWVESAMSHLALHDEAVGVEGPVESLPWDPLRALSFQNDSPGGYLGGNIGLRRGVLQRLGGFDEDFPCAHCEDYDLGFRAAGIGPIGFAPAMRVLHHPRAQSAVELGRRGRLAVSEIVLFKRHRARYGRARRLPAVLFPFVNAVIVWTGIARRAVDSPRDAVRWMVIFTLYVGHLAVGVACYRRSRLRSARA